MKTVEWTPERIESFWDELAQTPLLEKLSFARAAAPYLIPLVLDHVKARRFSRQARALDFGGGNGHLAEALLQRGYRVGLYEPSAERRDEALERLTGRTGFLGALSEASDASFDALFALEVIEHVPEDLVGGVLERMRRFLRRGGSLVLSCPNSEDLDLNSVLCPVCSAYFHRWGHLRSISPAELVARLDAAGFECQWLGLVGFEDGEAILEWIRAREPQPPESWRERASRWREGSEGRPEHPVDVQIGSGSTIVYVGARR